MPSAIHHHPQENIIESHLVLPVLLIITHKKVEFDGQKLQATVIVKSIKCVIREGKKTLKNYDYYYV